MSGDGGFGEFFRVATGNAPYDYQRRLAGDPAVKDAILDGPKSLAINVPTGAGKTAAAVLAWLWNGCGHPDAEHRKKWPRRLVYCLPMRVLVEQTRDNVNRWVEDLLVAQLIENEAPVRNPRSDTPNCFTLMGGDLDEEWERWPEKPAILIGTQDMLLSRALNRGYAMSRYKWQMHFALLNNDCLWVCDEVQLMGPGLETTLQLDGWRGPANEKHRWPVFGAAATWWMSATLSSDSFVTVDRQEVGLTNPANDRPHSPIELRDEDYESEELRRRRDARKTIRFLAAPPSASTVLDDHRPGTLTLVIFNQVRKAREFHKALCEALWPTESRRGRKCPKRHPNAAGLRREHFLLVHSQFRPPDRGKVVESLQCFRPSPGTGTGLIAVCTQVVEAGVDISAARLWSEMAPWASIVQRLGRFNRDGRTEGALAYLWMPQAAAQTADPDAAEKSGKRRRKADPFLPYKRVDIERAESFCRLLAPTRIVTADISDVDQAVALLARLGEAEAAAFRARLDAINALPDSLERDPEPVIRPPDLYELFDTDPDLYGGFTDVSRYIRSVEHDVDVHVFWRDFDGKGQPDRDQCAPQGDELCAVPFYDLAKFIGERGRAWMWNDEGEQWREVRANAIRPGMTLLLPRTIGGYAADKGWTGHPDDVLDPDQIGPCDFEPAHFLEADPRAGGNAWLGLGDHTQRVCVEIEKLCDALGDGVPRHELGQAALRHDDGKHLHRAQGGVTRYPWQDEVRRYTERMRKKASEFIETNGCDPATGFVRALLREGLRDADELAPWAKFPDLKDLLREALRSNRLKQQECETIWNALRSQFRPGLRHECASALAARQCWLRDPSSGLTALTVYLIAAHHGKVRMSLRSTGRIADINDRNAFGIMEADELHGEKLDLECMEMGDIERDGRIEPSWTRMVLDLLGPCDPRQPVAPFVPEKTNDRGPFLLAYLEALVRVADWRGSGE
jgi:CRISPR-associated endonuclease/helicase Cas3